MKKPPLIFIPGLLCDHGLWERQAESLADAADGIITDKHLHHESIGRIAEAILSEAPPRFALAGLSMGGYVALEICRQAGQRVERLALLDTSGRADTPEQTIRREKLMTMCRREGFGPVTELLFPLLVHPDRQDDECLKRRILGMAARIGPDIFFRQQHAIMHRKSQLANLPAISCPTLVICGEQDQITPLACSREMAAAIPNACLATIVGCGHMSTMEKPGEVSALLHAWLTDPH